MWRKRRNVALQVRKADPTKPMRIVIYGIEGVGKSTLGAYADDAVFISPEGGADHLTNANDEPVSIIDGVNNWGMMRKKIRELIDEDHKFKTLVLDTADWTEALAHAHILSTSNSSGKSISTVDGGYGAGFRKSAEMHKSLIEDLEILRTKKKMHMVVTAHYHVRDVKDPNATEDYQAFEIKCHELVSALWREWADVVAFAAFNVEVKSDEGSKKARATTDHERVVYLTKQPSFQAKNRYGMPHEMPFSTGFWKELKKYAYSKSNNSDKAEFDEMVDSIKPLLGKIKDDEIKTEIKQKLSNAGKDIKQLRLVRDEIKKLIGE